MKTYTCHLCSQAFLAGHKQPDPEQDRGFGTCTKCQDDFVKSMVRYGYGGRDFTWAQAKSYVERYA